MVELLKAKDGTDTLKINNKFLHSSYSPAKEVQKFIDNQFKKPARTFIVLGESLGVIRKYLQYKYPDSKIITLYYISNFRTKNENLSWSNESSYSIQKFLEHHLLDSDLPGLSLVSWPNSEMLFPEMHAKVLLAVNSYIRIRTNSLITTGNFGRKWIRNSFASLKTQKDLFPFNPPKDKPILIIASGYSLTKALHHLKDTRETYYLWSLPSAIDFLLHNNIIPDYVIQTDPGFYASHHIRKLEKWDIPLVYPISSLPPVKIKGKSYLFSQGTEIEHLLLKDLNSSLISIPSTGTVAAAALLLAIKIKCSEIYLFGLDLISTDIHSHVSPHSFEFILDIEHNRTHSKIDIMFDRNVAKNCRHHEGWQSESLKTYADWFNTLPQLAGTSIFRVNPSSISIPNFGTLTSNEFKSKMKNRRLLNSKTLSKPKKLKINIDESYFDEFQNLLVHAIDQVENNDVKNPLDKKLEFLLTHLSMVDYFKFLKADYKNKKMVYQNLLENCLKELIDLRNGFNL